MNDILGFFIFSTIEGIGIFIMMMAIFRLKPYKHLLGFIPVLLVMVFQSFILREELSYPFLVPVVSILLFVLYQTVILRLPLVWSFIITLTGYTAFSVLQAGLLYIEFGGIENFDSKSSEGYILQASTAALQISLSLILLKYRIGFTADFDSLRLRAERIIVIAVIALTILGLALVALSIKAMFIVVVSFAFFLLYSIKKERES
ncbi:hypothetical protein [Bacillus sp. FJAT-26390]|uniref:hypothetical protein n=1 Tax=Bacillus sp. FJAT-26390 TaxID=1743142 RepID=UPI000807D302|nr:hypothetical protein [Bacillus sp. FJAT-26390]OBZ08033.1 hypothetical protein A7975_27280 [Bacillus sp. FJAT-26390]